MSIVKINEVELEVRFTDANFAERAENAYDELMENVNEANKKAPGLKESEGIREVCRCARQYFDTLFGAGTAERVFGERMDMLEHLDAVSMIADEKQRSDKALSDRANQYLQRSRGNREQRRYDKRHGKGKHQNGNQNGQQQNITVIGSLDA